MIGDAIARILMALVWFWGAWQIARVGEPATRMMRSLMAAAMMLSGSFWLALHIVDPAADSLRPWWTAYSRVSQVSIPLFIGFLARRRREINGFH